jgi:hypothetical protein
MHNTTASNGVGASPPTPDQCVRCIHTSNAFASKLCTSSPRMKQTASCGVGASSPLPDQRALHPHLQTLAPASFAPAAYAWN